MQHEFEAREHLTLLLDFRQNGANVRAASPQLEFRDELKTT